MTKESTIVTPVMAWSLLVARLIEWPSDLTARFEKFERRAEFLRVVVDPISVDGEYSSILASLRGYLNT
jgi:hypothetical protein